MSHTPILTYHKIATRPKGTIYPGTYVDPSTFERHVAYVARRYATVTLRDYLLDRESEGRIVLTFDDGTADFTVGALPALHDYESQASVFLVTAESTNAWDVRLGDAEVPLLARQDVRLLVDRFEFGSHTRTHVDLSAVSEDTFGREIVESRREVEEITGRPCKTFCYPYGRKRESAIQAVRAAGYAGAVSTDKGANDTGTDPFQLRRIAVRHDTSLPVLIYKLWRARRFQR